MESCELYAACLTQLSMLDSTLNRSLAPDCKFSDLGEDLLNPYLDGLKKQYKWIQPYIQSTEF